MASTRVVDRTIAYLILAHSQPRHLARLIRALDEPDVVFFIHVDANVDHGMFEREVAPGANVVFLEDRIPIVWGEISLVAATLALLSAARSYGAQFHRFCLLSGADFPIKRTSQIRDELASTKELIRIDRRLTAADSNTHVKNVRFYWFPRSAGPEWAQLSGTLARNVYAGIDFFHGSQWWALTRDCVDYVLEFVAAHPAYYVFHQHTRCPDEIFFHSIVKHSPFASRITHDFQTVSDQAEFGRCNDHGGHYIDWNARRERLPKVLDLADYEPLARTTSLFARKFDEIRSEQLLAKIEDELVGR